MRKTISVILILLLILYLLLFPSQGARAAASGLLLWYRNVLPVLLPFAIISDIFISTNAFYMICHWLHPFLHLLLPVSLEGTYPMFAGFLFGFPMGSRICAQMLQENKLSYTEASILYRICNNLSPAFISNYIVLNSFHRADLIIPTYLILYIPALMYGRFLYHGKTYHAKKHIQNHITCQAPVHNEKPASGFRINFKIIDAGIMNGFETLVKLGGYIMFFAILASVILTLPIGLPIVKAVTVGVIEITNGINTLSTVTASSATKYVLMMILTALGGFSGIAQTSSMIGESKLSISNYIMTRILLAFSSGLLAIIYIYCCGAF